MSLNWYVLHSKPNKEQFLASQLQHRDIETFYPRLHVEPVNPRSRKVRPFFPGYLFVHVDLDEISLSSLAWVPGAHRLVSFDDEPATVPDDVIAMIRKNVDRLNHDPKKFQHDYQHGDPVTIESGPLKGYHAIFDSSLDGTDRVRLLVQLLHGEHIRVQVERRLTKPKK